MRKISVRGIVLHEGKLLCVKLKPYNDLVKADSDWWCLPGGTVEEGEGLENALVREMLEETGIVPVLGKLIYVHQFAHNEKEYLEFFFHVTNSTDYTAVDLKKTTHGSKEIEKINFINPKQTPVLPKFLTQEDFSTQLEKQAPVKFFSFFK